MVGAWDEGCTVMPVNSYANYVQFMGFGADFGGTMQARMDNYGSQRQPRWGKGIGIDLPGILGGACRDLL